MTGKNEYRAQSMPPCIEMVAHIQREDLSHIFHFFELDKDCFLEEKVEGIQQNVRGVMVYYRQDTFSKGCWNAYQ